MWHHIIPGWAVLWLYGILVLCVAFENGVLLPLALWVCMGLLLAGVLRLIGKRRGWGRKAQLIESGIVAVCGAQIRCVNFSGNE